MSEPINILAGGQSAKQWCKYCHVITLRAPAHPGRPRACSVCHHPYDPNSVPPSEVITNATHHSTHGVKAHVSGAPHDHPTLPEPCFHLRDRNNNQTVHPEPQSHNACYARLRLRRRWLSPDISVEPTPLAKSHQTRYCFADYTECPFFLPGGTPPALIDEDDHTVQLQASA